MAKRNLTVELDSEIIRKAKVLAARRETSISRLVAQEIERLVGEDETYARARSAALTLLEQGFDMGSGGRLPSRDEIHER